MKHQQWASCSRRPMTAIKDRNIDFSGAKSEIGFEVVDDTLRHIAD